jgi:dynactin complex subunit
MRISVRLIFSLLAQGETTEELLDRSARSFWYVDGAENRDSGRSDNPALQSDEGRNTMSLEEKIIR